MVIDDFIAWLDSQDRNYSIFPDKRNLCLCINGINAIYFCMVRTADNPRPFISINSRCGLRVPESKYAAISELIIRINEGVRIGRFGLDMNDGDLYYNTSCMVRDGELPESLFEPYLFCNLSTIDRFIPAIYAVLFKDVEPEDAFRATLKDFSESKEDEEENKKHEDVDDIVKKLLEGILEPLEEQPEEQSDPPQPPRKKRRKYEP